jgi:hypothetical protein
MRVFIMPGAYAFTVIPYFPKSEAFKENLRQQIHEQVRNDTPAAWVNPRIANLDAQYAAAMPEPALIRERTMSL